MREPQPGEIVMDGRNVNIGAPVVVANASENYDETRRPEDTSSDEDKEK